MQVATYITKWRTDNIRHSVGEHEREERSVKRGGQDDTKTEAKLEVEGKHL